MLIQQCLAYNLDSKMTAVPSFLIHPTKQHLHVLPHDLTECLCHLICYFFGLFEQFLHLCHDIVGQNVA